VTLVVVDELREIAKVFRSESYSSIYFVRIERVGAVAVCFFDVTDASVSEDFLNFPSSISRIEAESAVGHFLLFSLFVWSASEAALVVGLKV